MAAVTAATPAMPTTATDPQEGVVVVTMPAIQGMAASTRTEEEVKVATKEML